MKKKTATKIILVLLSVMLIVGIMPIGMLTVSAYSGNGSETSPYLITSASDLAQFATDVNNGVNTINMYYKLTADIDISGYENWTPIGSYNNAFKGYFDGGNYTISGLTIKTSTDVANSGFGLFGSVDDSAVQDYRATRLKNIKLAKVSVECTSSSQVYVGSLAGYASRLAVKNCSASTAEGKTVSGPNAGGLIGYTSACDLNNLSNNCDVTATGSNTTAYYAGGITSTARGCNLINLRNDATVSNIDSTNMDSCVGGITGCAWYCSSLTGLVNTGNVNGTCSAGGITGYTQGMTSGTHTNVSNSYNTGTITSSGNNTGGLIGQSQLTNIGQSFNFGKVNGTQYTGGIIGRLGNQNSNGVDYTKVSNYLTNCYNTASVSGTQYVGGIAGQANQCASVTKTYSASSVQGSSYIGALTGNFIGLESSNNFYAPAINPALASYFNGSDYRKGAGVGSNQKWNATPLTVEQMTDNSVLTSGNDKGLMSALGSEWKKRTNDASIYYPELNVFYTSSESEVQATSRLSVTAAIPPTYSFSISPQPADYQTPIILPTVSEGYKSAAFQTVLVSNTGTGDTGVFTLSLAQASLNYFSLSKATMASLASGGSDSFTVTPKTGLAPGTYQDYVEISCSNTNMQNSDKNKGFLVEFTVVESVTKDIISLSPFDDKTFTTKTEGYGPVAVHTVDVSNTGTEDTGELTVSLSGTNADSFTLSKTTIADIAANGSDDFTVVPKTGLPVGTYTATVTVSSDTVTPKSFDVFFTVEENKDVIVLNPFDDKTFTPAAVGYSPVTAYDVNLSNTGTKAIGELTVLLSGPNADSFMLSKTTIASLVANGSNSFTVVPKTGLAVGTYIATVTLSGDNIIPKSFGVSFTVKINPPTATGGIRTVTVREVTDGATLKLYKADGTIVTATPNKNTDGNYTYSNVEPGAYYVTQTVNGIESGHSNTVTVTSTVPTATGGTRTITVKDVIEGATLKLYKADGTIVIAIPIKNTDGTYTYTNVEPGTYYVTQTVNGVESGHSNIATVTSAAPTATGGTRTITVKDVTEGATLKLYKALGTIVIATPTKNTDGTYTYTNLEPGTYYITQTVNGIESGHFNTETVTPEPPIAPTLTGGTKTITVNDVKDDATIKLYKADGTIVIAIQTKNLDGTYTYKDLEPGDYYVTQTVDGVEGVPSGTFSVTDDDNNSGGGNGTDSDKPSTDDSDNAPKTGDSACTALPFGLLCLFFLIMTVTLKRRKENS